jgi:5-methylcytosine-specific restriction endonuclease McrA
MTWVLLLNRSYDALHFISKKRALKLMCNDKVVVYDSFETGKPSVWEDKFIHTASGRSSLPATLRLKEQVTKRWKPPKWNKRAMFNRDGWVCQYCGAALDKKTVTIDHVIPRSQGGRTDWLNCVTACQRCNREKANKTPSQAGMKLLNQPAIPNQIHFWDSHSRYTWHDDWNTFFKS